MADLGRLTEDLGYFAEQVGWPLAPFQLRALGLESRTTVVVAPRQSGKSRSLAVLGLHWAYRRRGQRVLVVSAGEEASRRLLGQVREVVAGSPLLRGSVVDETAGLVRLSNGSEVRSVPASERQVRGWTVDLLLVDEAAMVPDDLLLGAAIPTTAARPDARIVLASSASRAEGALYDSAVRGEQGSDHTRTFRWSLEEAEWIAPSVVSAARDSMAPARFAAEYLGQFASGADALFSRRALDDATADYRLPSFEALTGPARVLGGIDWGAVNDRSAIVCVGRLADVAVPTFAVAALKRWPAGAPLTGGDRGEPGVIGEIAGSSAHFAALYAEANGLGAPCCEDLFRRVRDRPASAGGGVRRRARLFELDQFEAAVADSAKGRQRAPAPAPGFATTKVAVTMTAPLKAAIFSSLRLLLDRGRLVLPAGADDLTRELLALKVEVTQDGGERIETGGRDVAIAFALALGPQRDRRGGWATFVSRLADGRRLPKPAPYDLLGDVPTVATGAGLQLPRTPVWQSVASDELTFPEGTEWRPRRRSGGHRVNQAKEAHV